MDFLTAKRQILEFYGFTVLGPHQYSVGVRLAESNKPKLRVWCSSHHISQNDFQRRLSVLDDYPVFLQYPYGQRKISEPCEKQLSRLHDFVEHALPFFYNITVLTKEEYWRFFDLAENAVNRIRNKIFLRFFVQRQAFIEDYNVFLCGFSSSNLVASPHAYNFCKRPKSVLSLELEKQDVYQSKPISTVISIFEIASSEATKNNRAYCPKKEVSGPLSPRPSPGNQHQRRHQWSRTSLSLTMSTSSSCGSSSLILYSGNDDNTHKKETLPEQICWSPFTLQTVDFPLSSLPDQNTTSTCARRNANSDASLQAKIMLYLNTNNSYKLNRLGSRVCACLNPRKTLGDQEDQEEESRRANLGIRDAVHLPCSFSTCSTSSIPYLSSILLSFSSSTFPEELDRGANALRPFYCCNSTTALGILYSAFRCLCYWGCSSDYPPSFTSSPSSNISHGTPDGVVCHNNTGLNRFSSEFITQCNKEACGMTPPAQWSHPISLRSTSAMEGKRESETLHNPCEREVNEKNDTKLSRTTEWTQNEDGSTTCADASITILSRSDAREEQQEVAKRIGSTNTEAVMPTDPMHSLLPPPYQHIQQKGFLLGLRILLEATGSSFCIYHDRIDEKQGTTPFRVEGTGTVSSMLRATTTTNALATCAERDRNGFALCRSSCPYSVSTPLSPLRLLRFSCFSLFSSLSPLLHPSSSLSFSPNQMESRKRRGNEVPPSPWHLLFSEITARLEGVPLRVLARCYTRLEHFRLLFSKYIKTVCKRIRFLSTSSYAFTPPLFDSAVLSTDLSPTSSPLVQEGVSWKTENDIPIDASNHYCAESEASKEKDCFLGCRPHKTDYCFSCCSCYSKHFSLSSRKLSSFIFLAICQRFYPLPIICSTLPFWNSSASHRERRGEGGQNSNDGARFSISISSSCSSLPSFSSPRFHWGVLPSCACAQQRASTIMRWAMMLEGKPNVYLCPTSCAVTNLPSMMAVPSGSTPEDLSRNGDRKHPHKCSCPGGASRCATAKTSGGEGKSQCERWCDIPWLMRCDVLMAHPRLSSDEQLVLMEDLHSEYKEYLHHRELAKSEDDDLRSCEGDQPGDPNGREVTCPSLGSTRKETQLRGGGGVTRILSGTRRMGGTEVVPCSIPAVSGTLGDSAHARLTIRTTPGLPLFNSPTAVKERREKAKWLPEDSEEREKLTSTAERHNANDITMEEEWMGKGKAEEDANGAAFEQWWRRSDAPVPLRLLLAGLLHPQLDRHLRGLDMAQWRGCDIMRENECPLGESSFSSPLRTHHHKGGRSKVKVLEGQGMQHCWSKSDAELGDWEVFGSRSQGEVPDIYSAIREALERHKQEGALRLLGRGEMYYRARGYYYSHWIRARKEEEKIF